MIIGRNKETKLLNKVYASKEAEFVVIYGRRRIGKTYLIREFFAKKKCLFMHVTGVDKGSLKTQLTKFAEAMSKTFFNEAPLETPRSWEAAFSLLNKQFSDTKGKIVIFLDELPWLATRRSELLQVIDYYWNHHWSKLKNIIFVICGSSASWVIKNIIYNKGGLHNRTTCEICLQPFTLHEAKTYLHHRKIKLNDRHILSLYMALGGVPYYLKYIENGYTAEQNIQQLIFDNDAPLRDEFYKLFKSLFNDADAYIEIIKLLSKTKTGMRRAELQEIAKYSNNGGRLTERLKNLCSAGFIQEYTPWQKQKGEYYKVIDEFCLFYLHWVKDNQKKRFTKNHWLDQERSSSYTAWAGYAFESICFKHVEQIIKALNIRSGGTIDSWRFVPRKHQEQGAQIDLLIDRNDDAITICEVKYTVSQFVIDKSYSEQLKRKIAVFKERTGTDKQLFIALVSASGMKSNKYSEELISGVVTLEGLFAD